MPMPTSLPANPFARFICQKVPAINPLRHYSFKASRADFLAGPSVAAVAVPQPMLLAALPADECDLGMVEDVAIDEPSAGLTRKLAPASGSLSAFPARPLALPLREKPHAHGQTPAVYACRCDHQIDRGTPLHVGFKRHSLLNLRRGLVRLCRRGARLRPHISIRGPG
jgi:hypothetical protein